MGKGKVNVHEGLAEVSSAYRDYVALERLPISTPAFDLDEAGQPRLEIAEIFCRMSAAAGQLCGAKLANTPWLRNHIRYIHKIETVEVHRWHQTPAMLEDAKAFYAILMEGHEPSHQDSGEEVTPAPRSLRKRKSAVINLISDDEGPDTSGPPPAKPRRGRPRKKAPSKAPSHRKDDLELELKKIAIEKKLFAAELRELELQQTLAEFKKG